MRLQETGSKIARVRMNIATLYMRMHTTCHWPWLRPCPGKPSWCALLQCTLTGRTTYGDNLHEWCRVSKRASLVQVAGPQQMVTAKNFTRTTSRLIAASVHLADATRSLQSAPGMQSVCQVRTSPQTSSSWGRKSFLWYHHDRDRLGCTCPPNRTDGRLVYAVQSTYKSPPPSAYHTMAGGSKTSAGKLFRDSYTQEKIVSPHSGRSGARGELVRSPLESGNPYLFSTFCDEYAAWGRTWNMCTQTALGSGGRM
jgi:hypothetical protein